MNDPAFTDLTIIEKYEFIGKLVIAAQTDYFSQCTEIVNLAQTSGLYKRVKPITNSENNFDNLENY